MRPVETARRCSALASSCQPQHLLLPDRTRYRYELRAGASSAERSRLDAGDLRVRVRARGGHWWPVEANRRAALHAPSQRVLRTRGQPHGEGDDMAKARMDLPAFAGRLLAERKAPLARRDPGVLAGLHGTRSRVGGGHGRGGAPCRRGAECPAPSASMTRPAGSEHDRIGHVIQVPPYGSGRLCPSRSWRLALAAPVLMVAACGGASPPPPSSGTTGPASASGVGSPVATAGAPADSAPARDPAAYPPAPAVLPPLPPDAFPAARPPDVVRAVYEFAARHPEVLAYVPCFCGCEHAGHRGNDDCFVRARDAAGQVTWDAHGAT